MSSATRFGPYLLESRIAVGGTAEVYLAKPVDSRAEVQRLIVKRLLPHMFTDEEGRRMFEREAALHAVIEHENVVKIFGAGQSDKGEPYLAMEFVDGVDGYRLLRRVRQEGQTLPVGLAVHMASEVLHALEHVHSAKDGKGKALGIIHRDVTPSNIYLSKDGLVKLGDFGIARSATRMTIRNDNGPAMLKGTFAYLAPEQVAGETFDHRSDLFSLAVVLAEMLLGKPLFPGGGQLAVLLAIRDCKIDALVEIKAQLPAGLFEVLQRALSRDPAKRYPTAHQFAEALRPFATQRDEARLALAQRVRWVQAGGSTDAMAAVRDSAFKLRAAIAATQEPSVFEQRTAEYTLLPSNVVTANGQRMGPLTFAKLMECLATGQIGLGDKVDYMGRGLLPVEQIEELARFLPTQTATTNQLVGPGVPDIMDQFATTSMLDILMRFLRDKSTGVLFTERPASDGAEGGRKELYFLQGKLHHVASSNASELLGEYLVRRGKLAREELDLALAVLPRYGGRMGDTLISLGLVGPVDIFRAIREQGRDRVADLFLWKQGTASFYRGQTAPRVEFPLDLDLPTLMLAGLEASQPLETPMEQFRGQLDSLLEPGVGDHLQSLSGMTWPPLVQRVLSLVSAPKPLREVLKAAARVGQFTAGDVLRALEILLAAQLVRWGK